MKLEEGQITIRMNEILIKQYIAELEYRDKEIKSVRAQKDEIYKAMQ